MAIKSEFCQAPECDKLRDKKRGSAYCMMHRTRRSRFKSIHLPEKKKLPDGIVKVCKKHGELKECEAYKVPNRTWYHCKVCKSESLIKFEERNPNRESNKNRKFMFVGNKHKLRIEISVYEQLYEMQKGLCAICNKPETMISSSGKGPKKLAVDHCHITQVIRGLLCHRCNVSLGSFDDSIERLLAAIAYLEKHKITR